MKIYRVMPDSFSVNGYLNEAERFAAEYIYYKMGYFYLSKNVNHRYNSIGEDLTDEDRKSGRYFFLFLDDTICNGYFLLNSFHNLNINSFLIAEYEVPSDLVLKHIGYGNYANSSFANNCLECYITENDIKGIKLSSDEIFTSEKEEGLFRAFQDSLSLIASEGRERRRDFEFYRDLFGTEDLNLVLEDKDKLRQVLNDSPFFETFMNSNYSLVKTPFLTGRIISVNKYDDWYSLARKYDRSFEDDNDKEIFKRKIMTYCKYNDKEGKEKIKTLFSERKII